MLHIDGTYGEGGGQVLRSSLALSIITGTPFTITDIRGKRKKGGLGKQHLTSVLAAAEICNATVEGAHLLSKNLTFSPKNLRGGDYEFRIGSAGSSTLVLQTVLPPLLTAKEPSRITIFGGTHNMKAPPTDFIEQSFFPLLQKMGAQLTCTTDRYGFFPVGGGKLVVTVMPAPLKPLHLESPGKTVAISSEIVSAHRPLSIMQKQADTIAATLPDTPIRQRDVTSAGPGGAVMVRVEKEHVTELFTGFSKRDIPHHITAKVAAERASSYAEASYTADSHLTDQLMLPMILAKGGSFSCAEPSLHATTNAEIIRQFTEDMILFRKEANHIWHCSLQPRK